jgi:hypothetical protein
VVVQVIVQIDITLVLALAGHFRDRRARAARSKLVAIRSDKHAGEVDKVSAIEELYYQQRMG